MSSFPNIVTFELTDKAITKYALAGRYGPVIQQRALDNIRKPKKLKATKPVALPISKLASL